jgi:hypothetical protein
MGVNHKLKRKAEKRAFEEEKKTCTQENIGTCKKIVAKLPYEVVSIISGTGAAICKAVVAYLGSLGVSIQHFTQFVGRSDCYVILFGVLYLA